MATYNGSKYIMESISSVISQTFADFELIIVDDCSTDGTSEMLQTLRDPRVRVLHNVTNMGVVGSRNRCFAEARGTYIAMLDHDDLSQPTRLQRQVAYLDSHPDTVLVATDAHVLSNGALTWTKHPRRSTPPLLNWLLHVGNPLVCSSVMFRAAAVRQLGSFMREDYTYADDYDLYHRLNALGSIARLDEPLTIYRLHANNTFRKQEDVMAANATKVLAAAYARWFGNDAERAASLIARHLDAGRPILGVDTLWTLRRYFNHLIQSILAEPGVSEADQTEIHLHANMLWQQRLRASARCSFAQLRQTHNTLPELKVSANDYAHVILRKLPFRSKVRRYVVDPLRRPASATVSQRKCRFFGTAYLPAEIGAACPPTLFVVVDTEAEFDWTKPFSRDLTNVAAMDSVERGQAVFDRYGLRPIYVVDFPVASQARSVERLRQILDRSGCSIGAHLHPWTNPPFEEDVSDRNSFAGNLPPALEERKLACLIEVIQRNLGVTPKFYKAGRYGLGPATAAMIGRHGIEVDLSVLPGADLHRIGGPDYRKFRPVPYWIPGGNILSLPMTRGYVGMAPWLGSMSERAKRVPGWQLLRLQSVLSRTRIVDTIPLTPEGTTAGEQIRLIKAMLRRGNRLFVMSYHSPSLSPGHTSYVRTAAEADAFVTRMQEVCRYFFEELGGMPGSASTLLRLAEQQRANSVQGGA